MSKKITNIQKRKFRIRKKIKGLPDCPRLSLFISNKYITAQIIDDVNHHTLVYISSQEFPEITSNNIDAAKKIAEELTKKAATKNISKVVFDRNGKKFHGRVKAFADTCREQGLQF